MGERILRVIEWLLLGLEAWMVSLMVWVCRILGVTSDEVELFRERQKDDAEPPSMTPNPRFPPEPRLPSKRAPRPKRRS